MGMGIGENGNRDVGKMGMEIRHRTGNGNGMGIIPRAWDWEQK